MFVNKEYSFAYVTLRLKAYLTYFPASSVEKQWESTNKNNNIDSRE